MGHGRGMRGADSAEAIGAASSAPYYNPHQRHPHLGLRLASALLRPTSVAHSLTRGHGHPAQEIFVEQILCENQNLCYLYC
jgi:hypothetical protein